MSAGEALRAALAQRADRALELALAKPRALQAGAAALCALLLGLSLAQTTTGSGVTPARPRAWPTAPAAATGISFAQAKPGDADEQAAVEAVAAYNRASAEAARLGRSDMLAPHMDPLGAAWPAAQAEYARRLARGELHQATLRRWGVLSASVQGQEATVVTQELWDDVTRVDGTVTASVRGALARVTYRMRRGASGWLIVDVASEALVR